jgi:hypothetical protein
LLLGTSSAAAQGWLADRTRAEGRGIRLGDFELHPGIGAEGGYDSNLFLAEPDEEYDTAILRVSPHIYLSTLSGERLGEERPRVTFRTGASGAFKYYFAPKEFDIGVGQDARLAWNASSIFTWEIFEQFLRTIDPFTEPAAPITNDDAEQLEYARDQLGVGTRLQLNSKGGLFKVGAGYRFDLDYFESDLFEANQNQSHTIGADTSWEFLPKTAIFWNGTVQLHSFKDDATTEAVSARFDSTRLSSKIGINGALTSKIGFTLATGYGAGFYEDDNDYENVLAQVELRWRLRPTILWALGYDREHSTAFQGNFALMDRIKTRLQAMLGGAVVISAKAELTFVNFGRDDELAMMGSEAERDDMHLVTGLGGEYRIIDWFAITADFGYVENFTDYVYVLEVPGPNVRDPAEYRKFEGWLGVRAFL